MSVILKAEDKERSALSTSRWNLKTLKKDLTQCIPKWIKEKTGKDLPFPPKIVSGITEDDVSALQETFRLLEIDRYSRWSEVYYDINMGFIEAGKTDKAGEIRGDTQEIAKKGVPCAQLFLTLAAVYCARREWPLESEKKVKEQARKLRYAVTVLQDAIGNAAPIGDVQASVGDWITTNFPGEARINLTQEELDELNEREMNEDGESPYDQSFALWLGRLKKVIGSELDRHLNAISVYEKAEHPGRKWDYSLEEKRGLLGLEALLTKVGYSQRKAATTIVDLFDKMDSPIEDSVKGRKGVIESVRMNLRSWKNQREQRRL